MITTRQLAGRLPRPSWNLPQIKGRMMNPQIIFTHYEYGGRLKRPPYRIGRAKTDPNLAFQKKESLWC